ncbi:lipopolysaccharide kinase [Aureococcus anophagefferens]|nr:lipopolysaccharide kinase [Aureococcus anophagefferens]
MHRDVKPENVLLGATATLVASASRAWRRPAAAAARCGTDGYWSPEMVRGEPYGTATDVWSLAVLLLELLAARHPFDDAAAVLAKPSASAAGRVGGVVGSAPAAARPRRARAPRRRA